MLEHTIHTAFDDDLALCDDPPSHRGDISADDDAVAIADGSGRVTFLNPVAERLTGWALDEARGRALTDVFHLTIDAAAAGSVASILGGLADAGAATRGTLRARDGAGRRVEVTVIPTRDGRAGVGEPRLVVFRDIASRQVAEARLRSSERLHRRKDDFLAELGHELRSPLAPILNAVRLLRQRNHGDPSLERAHGVIERQITRLTRLIEDLSDLSRLSADTLHLSLTREDVCTVVRGAIETCRPLFEHRHQQIAVALPRDPVIATIDAARIEQAIINLLTNASRYSHPGDRISLEMRAGDDIRIVVSDPGIGIERAMLPHVFELYARSPQANTVCTEGLGIGLTLVSRIAALHGGAVSAASAGPGRGATFTLCLPASKAMSPTAASDDGHGSHDERAQVIDGRHPASALRDRDD